jgi:nucleotide-binding universal stress UspA family protein
MAVQLVVGVGGDSGGDEAARFAARVASSTGGTVVLVFGYESSALGPRGGSLEEEIEAVGAEITDAVKADLAQRYPEVPVEVELVRDRPVESLIRVAEARGADAIVVGHGGQGPMRGALLGSITYEIVHRSPVPVVVVPDPDPDET